MFYSKGMVATYNGQEMNPAEDVQRREITRREQNTEEKTHSAKITARDNKKRKKISSSMEHDEFLF